MIFDDTQSNSIKHEEENYFVSMTDMMVGVLFIFIIMLMVFALDFRSETDRNERLSSEKAIELDQTKRKNALLEKETRRIFQSLQALQKKIRQEIASFLADAQNVRSGLLRDIRRSLENKGLHVEIDETNGVLRLTEKAVRFDINRSDLVGPSRVNVQKIAYALATVLPKYAPCLKNKRRKNCRRKGKTSLETVFIEGHTDKTGKDDKNWKLSTERAVNTYRAIIETRTELLKLRNRAGRPIISVSGYSSNRPIDRRETRDAYVRNRRIDLRFVMETDQQARLGNILQLTRDLEAKVKALGKVIEK